MYYLSDGIFDKNMKDLTQVSWSGNTIKKCDTLHPLVRKPLNRGPQPRRRHSKQFNEKRTWSYGRKRT